MSASHDDDNDDEPPTRAVSPAAPRRIAAPRAPLPRGRELPPVPEAPESDEDLATVVGVAFAKVARRAPPRPADSVDDLASTQAREDAPSVPTVARGRDADADAEPPSSIPRLDSDPDPDDDARATAVMRSPSDAPDLGEMLRRARTAGGRLPPGMITPTALERPQPPSLEDAPTLDGPVPSAVRNAPAASLAPSGAAAPRSYGADDVTLDGPSPLRLPRVYSEDAPTRERHTDKPVIDELPTLASAGGAASATLADPAWANAPIPHTTLRSAEPPMGRSSGHTPADTTAPRPVPPAPQSASALHLATVPEVEAERVRPAAFGAMVMGPQGAVGASPGAPWGEPNPLPPAAPGAFPPPAHAFPHAPPFAPSDGAPAPLVPAPAVTPPYAAPPHGTHGAPYGAPHHGSLPPHAPVAYPPYGYGAPAPAASPKRLVLIALAVVAVVLPLVLFVLSRLFADE